MTSSPLTTTVQIKELIRADILNRRIRPGERMKIADLAERFGSSPMPVREALHGLEGEGLVRIASNRGATVSEVSPKFIQDVSNVRRVLEVLLVGTAAVRIRADELYELRSIQDELRTAAAAGDTLGMLQANRSFHRVIYRAGDNAEAMRLLDVGWELVNSFRLAFPYDPARASAVVDEHDALIAVLERHDVDQAKAIADRHCRNSCDHLLQRIAASGIDLGENFASRASTRRKRAKHD